MTHRIPLWIDLASTPPEEAEAVRAAGEAVGAERFLDAADPSVARITIQGAADEARAAAEPGPVIVSSNDWTIIPLENLIAARRDRPGTLFALANDAAEAAVFRDTLDVGVHGIVLAARTAQDVFATDTVLRQRGARDDDQAVDEGAPALVPAEITDIRDAGTGDRVCIDCTTAFDDGEGLLVGSTARGFALVHAETIASEYVNARPFRVNAGALHSYMLGPANRTQYLSEAEVGTQVLAVRKDGATRVLTVGRAKIERRPHLIVSWQSAQGTGNAVLQNAETIRLVQPDGTPRSITELTVGDKILVHAGGAARHFGMPIKEKLVEK